jgi:type II secretion system protein C
LLTKAQLKNPKQMATLGVSAVLLVLCLWLLIAIIMQASSEPETSSPMARVPAAANVNWNWFASELSVAEDKEVTQVISDQLANANLNAKLLGVVMAGDASSATLKVNNTPEAVFKKGDDVGSNSVIVEIQPYRIVVNQNGVNKQILLQKPESIIETEQVSASDQSTPEDGFALANMFGAVPVMIDGNAGFKMNNLSDEMKQLSDMQEGDTITHIDGVAIQDLLANPQKWITLSGSSSLPVTVIRQGQEETIYINAASLSAKMLPNLGFMP